MNTSRKQSRVSRSRTVDVTLAIITLTLLTVGVSGGAGPGNDNRAPDLGTCQHLRALAGNKVAYHVYAEGVQIYQWNGTSWVFLAPEAELFADAGFNGTVGIHYAGPTGRVLAVAKSPVRSSTAVHPILTPFHGFYWQP